MLAWFAGDRIAVHCGTCGERIPSDETQAGHLALCRYLNAKPIDDDADRRATTVRRVMRSGPIEMPIAGPGAPRKG